MEQPKKQLGRREKVRRLQREAILEAAEEVFAAKGYHQAKMEDIAVLAEFATGSLYNYFPSKDKIFEAMFLRRINDLYDQLVAAMEAETEFLKLLRSLSVVHVAFMDEHRAFFEIFAALGRKSGTAVPRHLSEQFFDQYQRYERLVEKVLDIGIAQGRLRKLDPRTMAVVLTAVLNASIFHWIEEHPDTSFAERYPEILDILFFGLSAQPPQDIPGELWNPDVLAHQAASLRERHEAGLGRQGPVRKMTEDTLSGSEDSAPIQPRAHGSEDIGAKDSKRTEHASTGDSQSPTGGESS